MIYNAGTISFSGNTVTGNGTSFTAPASQIRIGQTLLIASNPVQLVQITAINSATSLTVTPAAAPAVSGQKYAILVTDSLSVAGLAQSVSELNQEYEEKSGAWEAFARPTANQRITVTINGVSMRIPSMGSLEASIGSMAKKGVNKDITSLEGLTTPLSIAQGGTGSKTGADALAALGALPAAGASGLKAKYKFNAAGSNVGIVFTETPAGGYGGVFTGWDTIPLSFNTNVTGNGQFNPHIVHRYVYPGVAAGAFFTGTAMGTSEQSYVMGHVSDGGSLTSNFAFNKNGSAYANAGSWVNASDIRIKRDVNRIEDPLEKMRAIRGVTWYRKDSGNFGIGFIAQEVQEVFPEAVTTNGFSMFMPDGSEIEKVLFPDTAGVSAALHHEAILALMDKNDELKRGISALREELEALKGKIAENSTSDIDIINQFPS